MMDIEKLIEDLRGLLKQYGEKIPYGELVGAPWPYSRAGDLVWQDPEPYFIEQAATALSTLQTENTEMQKQLNEFSEFLCHMTGGLLSKTNYTAQEMATAAEDYQQKVCGECDLQAENEKLRADVVRFNGMLASYQNVLVPELRVELERVKRERDEAVEYLRGQCRYCKRNLVCTSRKGPHSNCWEWRGQKED